MVSSFKLWMFLSLAVGGALGCALTWAVMPSPTAGPALPPALATLSARVDALAERLAVAPAPAHCAASISVADMKGLRAELRQALHEELSAITQQGAQQKAPAPVSSAEAPSPKSLEQWEQGQQLLRDAVHERRWGDDQLDTLHNLLPGMTAAQRQALTQQLSASINRGELSVETTGAPL